MTSSLVGSEMCIRDRAIPHPLRGRALPPRVPLLHRVRRRSRGRCHGAVSYTHLTLPTICSV
eukprot:9984886-Prorocentrum_lima.AAC.1